MAAFSVLFAFSHFLCRFSNFLVRCLRLRSSRCRSVPAIESSFLSIGVCGFHEIPCESEGIVINHIPCLGEAFMHVDFILSHEQVGEQ